MATASHLPPSNPVVHIVFSRTNFMSFFTASIHLLVALPPGLLPATSILLPIYSLSFFCPCPNHLNLASLPSHPVPSRLSDVLTSDPVQENFYILISAATLPAAPYGRRAQLSIIGSPVIDHESMNAFPSSLAGQIKKLNRPHMGPGQ